MNAYVHEENNQLPAFYALHLLYHQCFCDLYRVALPGYNFPISSTIEDYRLEERNALQLQCAEHAQAITSILQMALGRRMKSLVDSVCAICAYESSKIQVVYARTSSTSDQAVKDNIETNLRALDVIFSWDKKRDTLVSSCLQGPSIKLSHFHQISSLSTFLQGFGFSQLAGKWLIRNDAG